MVGADKVFKYIKFRSTKKRAFDIILPIDEGSIFLNTSTRLLLLMVTMFSVLFAFFLCSPYHALGIQMIWHLTKCSKSIFGFAAIISKGQTLNLFAILLSVSPALTA